MNYENVPELNLKTIKAEMNSGRMSLEAMEWLVERMERYEEALRFYEDKTLYGTYIVCEPETRIEEDGGKRARKALREEADERR